MGLGINLIKAERDRQQHVEGWTDEHDDKHVNNELALAAACYAVPDVFSQGYWPPTWDLSWYKSTTRIRDLVKAGALIAAEIDRLQRIEIKSAREKYIPKIKELVDRAFEEFGEEVYLISILILVIMNIDIKNMNQESLRIILKTYSKGGFSEDETVQLIEELCKND